MKLLLDTHVFLWWRLDSRRLKPAARRSIAGADLVFVSAASVWEITIKQALGRVVIDEPLAALIEASEFMPLNVTVQHAERVGLLPPHHGDPFDRMLIAQALAEGLTIVSHDERFDPYGVPVIWT